MLFVCSYWSVGRLPTVPLTIAAWLPDPHLCFLQYCHKIVHFLFLKELYEFRSFSYQLFSICSCFILILRPKLYCHLLCFNLIFNLQYELKSEVAWISTNDTRDYGQPRTLFCDALFIVSFHSLFGLIFNHCERSSFFSAFHPGVKVGLSSPCCLICFSLPSVYVYQQHALQPTATLTPLFHSVSNLIRVLSFLAALFCAGSCCCCSFDLMNSRYAHRRMGRSGNDSCCKIWISAHRNVSFFFFNHLPFF